jgi:acetyl-CoA C-acetyltransferase
VVVACADIAGTSRRRPVWIKGFGEHLALKAPTYATDMVRSPMSQTARKAFDRAGIARTDIDMVSIYDCYTITVLTSIEDAAFCGKGKGMEFVGSIVNQKYLGPAQNINNRFDPMGM